VLLLRAGKVLAAGPIGDTLTAANLSETFGMSLTLEARGGRFFAYQS
jgi:iron complex transport system ATP-binding protein